MHRLRRGPARHPQARKERRASDAQVALAQAHDAARAAELAMKDKDRRRRGSGGKFPRASEIAAEPQRRRHHSSAAVETVSRTKQSRDAEGIGGIKRRASLGAADLLASGVLALQG